jgi:hypothetical protein
MRNRRITPVVRVAQSASPAVVFIQTNGERRVLIRDWLGQVFGTRTQPFGVSGSGVVIRKEGFIITNYHVVRDAKEILVSFAAEFDDATYKAAMISFDENEDLALIKITRDREFATIPARTQQRPDAGRGRRRHRQSLRPDDQRDQGDHLGAPPQRPDSAGPRRACARVPRDDPDGRDDQSGGTAAGRCSTSTAISSASTRR